MLSVEPLLSLLYFLEVICQQVLKLVTTFIHSSFDFCNVHRLFDSAWFVSQVVAFSLISCFRFQVQMPLMKTSRTKVLLFPVGWGNRHRCRFLRATGCLFHLPQGFPGKHFAALGLRKIEEVEYSVCTWKRRVSFLCDFLVLEPFDVDI